MRLVLAISAVILATAAAPSVQAAPMTYGCDTAAGRFSAIELEMPSVGFVVSGTITPNEFRKDATWAPGAWVRVDSFDAQNSAEVRFMSGGPKDKEGLLTLGGKVGGAERKGDPQLMAIGKPFAFSIQVVSASEVVLTAGEQKAKLSAALGDKVKLRIACSTGDFVFSNLEWKSAP